MVHIEIFLISYKKCAFKRNGNIVVFFVPYFKLQIVSRGFSYRIELDTEPSPNMGTKKIPALTEK